MRKLFSGIAAAFLLMLGMAALPQAAQAACSNADGTTGTGTWPSHQYTQKCGSAGTTMYFTTSGADMYSAFSPWAAQDAVYRLAFQGVTYYLFHDYANFESERTADGIAPDPGLTPNEQNRVVADTEFGYYTLIFEETMSSPIIYDYTIPNTTAHETGHWIDYLYQMAPNAAYIDINGTITAGNKLHVTVHNSTLSGGSKTVDYTVKATDAMWQVANGLCAAIENDPTDFNKSSLKIVCSATGTSAEGVLSVTSTKPSGSAYTTAGVTYSVSADAGSTETISSLVGVLPAGLPSNHASDAPMFQHELAADWTFINGLSPCGGTAHPDTGYFSGKQDLTGAYFCGGTNGQGGSLQAPYNNTGTYPDNKTILSVAYPDIFGVSGFNYHELFAEEFAVQVNKRDASYFEGPNKNQANPYSRDWFIGRQNAFQCTRKIISQITTVGTLPTEAQWPVGCPKV